ncbi:MAG: hypothetical protein JW910_01240 [Anaerolineae bacterium]|nr:hypothetical protein [Anaerolineae bacterium]
MSAMSGGFTQPDAASSDFPLETPYRNLILAGSMGVGKREVAERVAAYYHAPLRDIDAEIAQREGMPPQEIRELFGVARLTSLETELCRELTIQRGAVIMLSASTVLNEANRRRLLESGVMLVLVTALNETLRRLYAAEGDRFHDPGVRARHMARLRREWQVRALPGLRQLDTTRLTVEQVVAEVSAFWQAEGVI